MNKVLAAIILSISCLFAQAQLTTRSPYSYYGIGDEAYGSLTSQMGMGYTSLAIRNPLNVNVDNPASLSQLKRVSFNFDVKTEFLTLNNGSTSRNNTITNINNISLGFPMVTDSRKKRKMAFAFGIQPYTLQGYDMSFSQAVENIGDVDYQFSGDGSITDGFLALSYDLFASDKSIDGERKSVLSLGVRGSYIFGTIERNRITQTNTVGATNLLRENSLQISDANFRIGLNFSQMLTTTDSIYDKKRKSYSVVESKLAYFTLGAYFTPERTANSFDFNYDRTFLGDAANPAVLDTLRFSRTSAETILPASYGVGLSLQIRDQWNIGLDLRQTLWSRLAINGVDQQLNDATRASIGAEFIPDQDEINNLFKIIRYRGGFNVAQTRLSLDDNALNRVGVSLGLGVPLLATSSTSIFNLGIELANRNSASTGSINETILNVNVGFTFTPNAKYDFWFFKRKYD